MIQVVLSIILRKQKPKYIELNAYAQKSSCKSVLLNCGEYFNECFIIKTISYYHALVENRRRTEAFLKQIISNFIGKAKML